MKDAEDEAFDELARRQGAWGGGFHAKRQMAADKLQEPEREALKLALEALDIAQGMLANLRSQHQPKMLNAYTAIKEALAQPAQQEALYGMNQDDWKDVVAAIAKVRDGRNIYLGCRPADVFQEWFLALGTAKVQRLGTAEVKEKTMIEEDDDIQVYKRPWVWLSDADIRETIDSICQYTGDYEEFLCKKIERKIRSINNG